MQWLRNFIQNRLPNNPAWRRALMVIGGVLAVYLIILMAHGGQNTIRAFIVEYQQFDYCFWGFIFWIFFFAQFVLPLRTVGERVYAFGRLLIYNLGLHGPAILIENGRIQERRYETERKGPGVIVLDMASAAVLRTPVEMTRAVGPGVTFTKHDFLTNISETVAEPVDLHSQRRFIGPQGNSNPFLPQQPNESPAEFEARQRMRLETRAFTRDGVEIVPNIFSRFDLIHEPEEGNTPYGFNPDSVYRLARVHSINASAHPESPERMTDIYGLPPMLAANVWRELLEQYTLLEIFPFSGEPPFPLDRIRDRIKERLTTPGSREHTLMLESGLKLRFAFILNLRLPPEAETDLVRRWENSWLTRARQEERLINQLHSEAAQNGRTLAEREYATALAEALKNLIAAGPPSATAGKIILAESVRGIAQLYRQHPQLHGDPETLRDLEQLLEWAK